ncbi:hypothetical protein B0O80DRAFT_436465, partial [Mortierella sp. GBAus27b]
GTLASDRSHNHSCSRSATTVEARVSESQAAPSKEEPGACPCSCPSHELVGHSFGYGIQAAR